MPSILEIIASHGTPDDRPAPKPLPLPEVQVSTLQEAFKRYEDGCSFKAGDLVTPRAGYNYKGVGKPHIVLEVAAAPVRVFEISSNVRTGSSNFGERLDVRVACHDDDGDIVAFWQESWRIEPYTGGAGA